MAGRCCRRRQMVWLPLRCGHGLCTCLHALPCHGWQAATFAPLYPCCSPGSGKTSLLNALAGRLPTGGRLEGSVLVNGEPRGAQFRSMSAFVLQARVWGWGAARRGRPWPASQRPAEQGQSQCPPRGMPPRPVLSPNTLPATPAPPPQDDLLFPNLTVREMLLFAARIRLPGAVSSAAKAALVEAVIGRLGLAKASGTLVGGTAQRGVSGGERQRVNIGGCCLGVHGVGSQGA